MLSVLPSTNNISYIHQSNLNTALVTTDSNWLQLVSTGYNWLQLVTTGYTGFYWLQLVTTSYNFSYVQVKGNIINFQVPYNLHIEC